MKIAILPNVTRPAALSTTVDICHELDSLDITYVLPKQLIYKLNRKVHADYAEPEAAVSESDIVIAVGGDGTMIRAAKTAAVSGRPVLGINAGNLAFMCGLENNELKLLSKLRDGEYQADKRMLLNITYTKNNKTIFSDYCVNDIVFSRGSNIQLAYIAVSANGQQVRDYIADGVIISTPTGSTAYSLAAGGPVVEPTLDAIILTPICPHSLQDRSMIFREDTVLEVRPSRDRGRRTLMFSCDGGRSIEFSSGGRVTVSKAAITADFIRIKSDSFIDILNKKLGDR